MTSVSVNSVTYAGRDGSITVLLRNLDDSKEPGLCCWFVRRNPLRLTFGVVLSICLIMSITAITLSMYGMLGFCIRRSYLTIAVCCAP